MAGIQNEAIETLRSGIRGQVLLPRDPGYDAARTIWNAMIDRKPGLIVRCAGVADVMRSVAFVRDHGLVVSIRGGGHNIAGNAVCDEGLMIDLSGMRSVHVNPETRRAYVEPGATLADFDHEAQAFGLATPLGINSTTGVAGLTLGGGFGWLTRKYGMSVDNLVSADVITAEGKRVRASAQENPDLFWAIRGGGGNFGVVTLFEFQLHPVGPEVFSGLVVFPFNQAKALLDEVPGVRGSDARGIERVGGFAQGAAAAIPSRGSSREGGRRLPVSVCRRHRGGEAGDRAAAQVWPAARRTLRAAAIHGVAKSFRPLADPRCAKLLEISQFLGYA